MGSPKQNPALEPGTYQHHSMACSPSTAFLQLHKFIAERMRMSHIYQRLISLKPYIWLEPIATFIVAFRRVPSYLGSCHSH
jgi:hypothetical protein